MDTKGTLQQQHMEFLQFLLKKYDGDGEYSAQQEENLLLSIQKSLGRDHFGVNSVQK